MINALFGLIGALSLAETTGFQSHAQAPLASPEVQAATSAAAARRSEPGADAEEPAGKLVMAAENLWETHLDGSESETEYEWLRVEIGSICDWASHSRDEIEAAKAGASNPHLLIALSLVEQIERSSCPATP